MRAGKETLILEMECLAMIAMVLAEGLAGIDNPGMAQAGLTLSIAS
jgi:hypothetical protein